LEVFALLFACYVRYPFYGYFALIFDRLDHEYSSKAAKTSLILFGDGNNYEISKKKKNLNAGGKELRHAIFVLNLITYPLPICTTNL